MNTHTHPSLDRPLQVVARGEHRTDCAVLGCGEMYAHVRAAESGFMIGYCHPHYVQANAVFGRRQKNAA